MSTSVLNLGAVAALLTRLLEEPWDAEQLGLLKERLMRHGAELQGQLPELLLRCPNPDEAVRHWLADKDLSHWQPQAHGGTAAQGWQFETAGWNRGRGAEAMTPAEIARAHADGGLDAMLSPGVASDISVHCLEAALLAGAIALAAQLLQRRQAWNGSRPSDRKELLQESVKAAGLSALSGAGLSLVVSLALVALPGGQHLMTAAIISSAMRVVHGEGEQAFSLHRPQKVQKRGKWGGED